MTVYPGEDVRGPPEIRKTIAPMRNQMLGRHSTTENIIGSKVGRICTLHHAGQDHQGNTHSAHRLEKADIGADGRNDHESVDTILEECFDESMLA